MEKRVLIAVVLSFLVLYIYQAYFTPAPPKRPPAGATSGPTGTATQAGAAKPAPSEPAMPAATPAAEPAGQAATGAVAPKIADAGEREIVVDTNVVKAVFSNRGAHVDSWELKRHVDVLKRPVNLVPSNFPKGTPRPFMLQTDDARVTAEVNGALFRCEPAGARLDGTTQPVTITCEYADAAGLVARKTFTLEPDSYIVTVSVEVTKDGQPLNTALEWGPLLGDVQNGSSSRYTQKAEGILMQGTKVERLDAKTLASRPVQEGAYRFAGVDDHYFIATALLDGKSARVTYEPITVPDPAVKEGHLFVAFTINPAGPGVQGKFYFGPKDFDILKRVDPELVKVINFGMFAFLAVPLLGFLKGINAYLGNYGWSIIALTFLINAAIFPLRHASVVSMRKLQDVQPEVKTIQDRYGKLKATDPERQKMNQEIMALYKERGVNPASGCVPMLLTIPILFAFYSLLSQAIELRGAPFMWWIHDLSVQDPLYITPIIMGVSMVVQQKMTPSTMDPAQQKMMMLMPVVFTFMFLWAPSGLVIYWLVSNVLAIAQQYFTNKLIGPTKPVPRPAAGRAKRVGGGKTSGAA